MRVTNWGSNLIQNAQNTINTTKYYTQKQNYRRNYVNSKKYILELHHYHVLGFDCYAWLVM